MDKTYFVSGFLYHRDTQQILLQKKTDTNSGSTWSLLGIKTSEKKPSTEVFKDAVKKLLNVTLKESDIHQIYAYDQQDSGESNIITYAEIKDLADFPNFKDNQFAWFTQKEISKLKLPYQTKQDLTVGQRVIDSSIRRDAGVLTIG